MTPCPCVRQWTAPGPPLPPCTMIGGREDKRLSGGPRPRCSERYKHIFLLNGKKSENLLPPRRCHRRRLRRLRLLPLA
eukprot:1047669-Prorocentrum_minimum.AAC.2